MERRGGQRRSSRIERINAEIKKQLAPILERELKDPRIQGMISIIKVDTDEDLKGMKVYLSILGAKGKEKEVLQGINSAKGYIKNLLKTKIELRSLPDPTFILDDSIEYGIHISEILRDIHVEEREEDNND